MRTSAKLQSFVLMLFVTATTAAQPKPAEAPQWSDLITQGAHALKNQDFDRAFSYFVRAEELARQQGNRESGAKAYFYLGLVRQQQAAVEKNDVWLTTAAELYARSIDLQPTGAALNNLARIWNRGENSNRVPALYERAIGLNDPNKAVYAVNYGRWLEERGQFPEAIKQYQLAASLNPEDSALQQHIVELLSSRIPSEHVTMSYLWELACRGDADLVVEETLRLASDPSFSYAAEHAAILAYALSRSSASRVAAALEDRRLLRWAESQPAIAEVVRLLQGKFDRSSEFPWWSNHGGPPEQTACHYSPLEAFRLLARSIGYGHERARKNDLAEKYYRVAVEIGPDEVDPNAFVDLANLYTKTGQRDKLIRASGEFEQRLFQGKGLQYQRGAHKAVYDYHRALGVMYSQLGVWHNPDRPYASALYQLENAEKAAQRVNANENWKRYGLEQPLQPDPALKVLLGETYAKTGQPEKSVKVRLDAAEEYARRGDAVSAKEVVTPLIDSEAQIAQPDRQRLMQIQQRIESMPVRRDIAVLTPDPPKPTDRRELALTPAPEIARGIQVDQAPAMTPPGSRESSGQLSPEARRELARTASGSMQGKSVPAGPLTVLPQSHEVRIDTKRGQRLRLKESDWAEITRAINRLQPGASEEDQRQLQQALEKFGVVGVDLGGRTGRLVFQRGEKRIAVPFEFVPPD